MTPQVPNDPEELRRMSDALLSTAIPDDIPRTDSIVDIVELIARAQLENAIEAGKDPETLRPCVRVAAVRLLNLGDDPSSGGERDMGAVQYSELATCSSDTPELLRRIRPADRGEFVAVTRIVGNDKGEPWAVVTVLGGVCPDEAGDMAGDPFVIVAHAHRTDSGEIRTGGDNGERVLEDDDAPADLRDTVKALLDMARSAK